MVKKYLTAAAMAALLGLAACGGKPADQQAAEDAQKINLDAMISQFSDAVMAECSSPSIDIDCATIDKSRDVIKSNAVFAQAMSEYDRKCPGLYGEKICAQGYAGFLADAVAARLAVPVSSQAQQGLQQRQVEAEQRAAAAKAEAERRAAEQAAQARAAAEEAARQAAEAAKAEAEKAANAAGGAENAVPQPAAPQTAAPESAPAPDTGAKQ